MFKTIFLYFACVLYPGTAAFAGHLQPVTEIDVVRNGSFEQGETERGPAGWSARKDLPKGVKLDWSSEKAHSGQRCLSCESKFPADRPWFWWEQRVELSAGRAYRVSAWVMTEKVDRSAILLVSFHDASGKLISRKLLASLPANARAWKKLSARFVSPAGTASGRLQFSMHGSGRAWLDDVKLLAPFLPQVVPLAAAKTFPITKPQHPLTIDGKEDDWQGAVFAQVNAAQVVTQAEAIIMDKEDSAGAADLSFTFSTSADSRSLYLLIKVRDDVHRTARPYWQGDSIQMALDTRYGRSADGYGPGDFALGISFTGGRANVIIDHKPSDSALRAQDIQAGYCLEDGGYRVEVAIPWRSLGMGPPSPNQRIGFTIIVNDNDGQGRKWAEWTPGIARGKRPADYGTLVFLGDSLLGSSLSVPGDELTDLDPLSLVADIVSLAAKRVSRAFTLTIGDGDAAPSETRSLTLQPGLNRIPLAYAAGSVPAGTHQVRLASGPLVTETRLLIQPLRATVEETRRLLGTIHTRMAELARLVKRGQDAGADVALPDATLATAEHFARWIPADVARRGSETLALREAKRLIPVLDYALAEIKQVLRKPQDFPAQVPPDVMKAMLRDGGWYVGDRPVFLIGFNGYDPDYAADLHRFGGNFTTAGGSAAAYLFRNGPSPDLEGLELHTVRSIRRAAELGIRSNIHFGHRMPAWLVKKFPEITAAEGHFMYYNIDHPEARRLTCQMMEVVARAVKDLPGVTCFDLWNEAAYGRMSALGLAKFRKSMQEKYQDVAELNRAWGTRYTSFNGERPVTRDPSQPAAYMDWVRWNDQRFTEYVREMRQAVRKGAPGALTTVKLSNEAPFVGTLNHAFRRQQTSRHNMGVDRWALAQLLEIQGCDTRPTLLSPDYAFAWRYPGMAYDFQRSIAPQKPIDDSEWHGIQTVYFENEDQPASFLNASLWFSYLHGMDMNLTWWWSRIGAKPKTQWFAGSLLTQPQLLDAWARNSITVQRFAPEIVAFQDCPAPVRLFFSKPSAILDMNYLDSLRNAYENLHWFGVAVGFVTEEMLLEGFYDCRVLVVPGARHVSPGVREALGRLSDSGVTLAAFGKDCLVLTPHGKKIAQPISVDWMVLKENPDRAALMSLLARAHTLPDIRCIGPDGQTSKPVEFRTVRSGDRKLGYFIGLGKTPVRIHIKKNGQPAQWRSLLTGKRFHGSRQVHPYDFDLIEFE